MLSSPKTVERARLPPHAYDSQRALEVESLTLSELVCFENSDFCVVNKPYDLQIDGARPATLEVLLKKLHPEFRELRFCHQLDYATSGLLLLAKSRSAAAAARDAFDTRMVVKRYQALVEGVFDGPSVVREPILEREDGCVEISTEGKSAETQFELSEIGEFMGQAVSQLEFLQSPDGVIKFAFISFILDTGLLGICVMEAVSMRHE